MLELGYAIMILPMVGMLPAIQAMWTALRAASPHPGESPMQIANPGELMQMMDIDAFISRQERHLARERAEG